MAFSSAVTSPIGTVFGNKRVVFGSYTNTGGSTGGSVSTGLDQVDVFFMQPTGTVVSANQPVVNGTYPIAGSVTIVTSANETGVWIAAGL